MLHLTSQDKKLRPILVQDVVPDKILKLLLNTAQFEVKNFYFINLF